MTALRLTLLGGFEAQRASGESLAFPRKKAQALLAYLALHPDEQQPRDKLAALLWGDASSRRARHSLRQALVTLRQSLPQTSPSCLIEDGDSVALSGRHVEVDVAIFERAVADAIPESLARAAALYRGPLLEGLGVTDQGFEEWLAAERERLHELVLDVLARLLGHQAQGAANDLAIQTAVRLLALEPTQEPVHRTLMRLYARQGRRGAALRQYQACVSVLERELGVGPEPETKMLYREFLLASLDMTPATPDTVVKPVEFTPLDRPTPEIPLVGRSGELTRLRQALDAAWARSGRAALVFGEAGAGKSRLIEALVAEAIPTGGLILVGRAHESEQILPFGLWIDVFRTVIPSMASAMGEPWRGELGRLFPELGAPAARQLNSGEEYVRLFEALAHLLQLLATARPLMIVVEDLHWADETSLRLLVSLTRRITERRVLIVGTLRSEEISGTPSLRRTIAQLGHQPEHLSVTLSPLSEEETNSLVRAMVSARSDEATVRRLGDRIWRFSEGNAFMAVETLRALRDRDALADDRDPALSPRVRDLVAARLDRLTERARRFAGAASVIGRDFDFGVLQRAAEASAADAADGVEELVGRRILKSVGERIDFTHERIREVIYDSLLLPYRRALHRAVALAIESAQEVGATSNALVLGHHFRAAEEWEPASRYLTEAGRLAASGGASREAITCFEQALEALCQLPSGREQVERAIDIRFDLRQACVPLADHRRILEHLREADSAARSIGDERRRGWGLVYRVHGLFLGADCTAAIQTVRRDLPLVEALDDPLLEESANVYAAQVHHWVGAYGEAVERLRRNISSAEGRLRDRGLRPKHYINTRMFLAWSLAELGMFSEAETRTREAVNHAEENQSVYWLVHALCGAGFAAVRRGVVDSAIRAAEQGVELCKGRDYPVLWLMAASVLGAGYALAQRHGEAISLLERCTDVAGELSAPIFVLLGQAQLGASRLDGAMRSADRALSISVRHSERGLVAWARWLTAEIHTAAATSDDGNDAYRQSLLLAEELGMRPLVAHCHRGIATASFRTGKRHQAQEHQATAITMYREMGMTYWQENAEAAARTML